MAVLLFSASGLTNAKLTELDLSDNAFGPIGVKGIQNLITSPTCFQLQELRLNNNGLGITGGKNGIYGCRPFGRSLHAAERNLSRRYRSPHVLVFKKSKSSSDLNDNTATKIGGRAIATAIYDLNKLRMINLGDCLLRCAGATSLAAAITKNHQELEDEGLDNGDDDSCSTDNDLEEDVDEIEIPVHSNLRKTNSDITAKHDVPSIPVTAKEFLESPTAEKFLALGDDRSCLIMEEINNDLDFDRRISTVLKLFSCVSLDNEEVKDAAFECADAHLMEVFELAEKQDCLSVLSNSLLVQLGLIKSEDKTFKPMTDLTGPLIVLEHVVSQPYFSRIKKEILQLFLSRPNKAIDACGSVKHKWLQTLYSFQEMKCACVVIRYSRPHGSYWDLQFRPTVPQTVILVWWSMESLGSH
uniref:Ran-GTPase activating protein 1 C-terminal domain-containing protein n=1 Tax=Strigamia maritima TaxID=126957 RepID=T1IT55_STRMM